MRCDWGRTVREMQGDGGGCEPRNTSNLQKLKGARKWLLQWGLQKWPALPNGNMLAVVLSRNSGG